MDLPAAVDPFIGTGGIGFGVGSTYPGPALPFGMIHAGPDSRNATGAPEFSHCAGYHYDDSHIGGFSLTRMNGTGVPDYGTFAFMPVDGMTNSRRDEPGYAATFDKADEEAAAGYYRVVLESGIEVEITTTLRAAMFRFTSPGASTRAAAGPGAHAEWSRSGGRGDCGRRPRARYRRDGAQYRRS